MFSYVCLILLPILLKLIFNNKKNKDKLIFSSFFIIFLLLLFFRNESVGVDLRNYKDMFNSYSVLSWKDIIYSKDEIGYKLLNKIIFQLGGEFRTLLIVCALISILPIWMFYIKESNNSILTILLFVNMSTFVMIFSGLRQAIAISIGIFAYKCIRDKKIINFLICVGIAFLFHQSAMILLFLLPVYHLKINKKIFFFIIVPSMILVLIFNMQIFRFVLNFLPEKYIDRYSGLTKSNAYSSIVLFVSFVIFSFIVLDTKNKNKELIGLRNIMVLIVFIQLFAPIHTLAMRFNYYFIIFIPIIIPKMIDYAKPNLINLTKTANVVMILFFFFYFFYSAYCGADILQVFPYKFFWSI